MAGFLQRYLTFTSARQRPQSGPLRNGKYGDEDGTTLRMRTPFIAIER